MIFGRVFLLAGVVLSSVTPLRAEPLASVGPWVVDYAETQCSAVKKYGQADGLVTLAIRPSPIGDTYELLVGRSRTGPVYATELKGTVNFGGGAVPAWVLHYGGKAADGQKADVYAYRIGAAEMARAASSAAVTFQIQGAADVSLQLDQMASLLAGLRTCTEDLKRYWNYEGVKAGTLSVEPRGDVRHVFTPGDYPDEALWKGKTGAAQYLLLVDEKGRVAHCHILTPSGAPVLDAMGCQVLRERAKMRPARDRSGRETRGAYITPPVNWQLAGF